jgi:FkbM family methyltransferase
MLEEFVKSKVTGGHYAFKTSETTKPFTNKMTEAMLVDLYEDDVVVDIGAYVGEYSMYCATKGVKEIHSYEATPNTFNLLSKNKRENMMIYNKAVVGYDTPTIPLYISSGVGVTNSITKRTNKKSFVEVEAIRYEEAVKNATVVKIDVEGAEYGYNIFQPHIRAYIIEFHPIVKVDWMSNVTKIMNELESNGYTPLAKPSFKHGWDLHGAWVKNK